MLGSAAIATLLFAPAHFAQDSEVTAQENTQEISQEIAEDTPEEVIEEPAEEAQPPEAEAAATAAEDDGAGASETGAKGIGEAQPEVPAEPERPTWEPFDNLPDTDSTNVADQPMIGPYVTDPLTGVAMGGYDPVSYFTSGAPSVGSAGLEYFWEGVSWFFSSQGNLEAFKQAPEYYAPQFGGHGAMSMARGYLSIGDPQIYLVLDDQLYLFYSTGNKLAFEQVRNSARLDARISWSRLRQGLVLR